jgi:hypothetical protein
MLNAETAVNVSALPVIAFAASRGTRFPGVVVHAVETAINKPIATAIFKGTGNWKSSVML